MAGFPAEHTNRLEWVDGIADAFEEQWLAGGRPDIRDFLADSSGEDRAELLLELVRVDWEHRGRCGESPSADDYLGRFPELLAAEETIRIELQRPIPFPQHGPVSTADRSTFRPHGEESTVALPSPDGNAPQSPGLGEAGSALSAGRSRLLGKFELLEIVGQGAFGTVYRARDVNLGRIVAVKIPRGGRIQSQDEERFLREAQSAARLNHPGIVPVHEVDRHEGMPYIVTEFVEGRTLDPAAVRQKLSLRETAQLVACVADALEFAHRHGIVHRDVKPTNILLDGDGNPHLTDFGLAKFVTGDAGFTTDGQVLGAPAYMSPEQARGESATVDARADVYSLGVVLYELITGERPFHGNVRMLLLQVLRDEPKRPRRLNDAIPRDLETICLKAMSKSPSARYASAGELADDLRRFVRGETVRARPVGRPRRAWRWCLRNPVTSSLLTAIAISLVAGIAMTSFFAVRASRYADEWQEQAELARWEALKRKLQLMQNSRLSNGWKRDELTLIATMSAIRVDAELRDRTLATHAGLDIRLERTFGQPGKSYSRSVAFDPSGKRLLFGSFQGIHAGKVVRSPARLWRVGSEDVHVAGAGSGPGGKPDAGPGSPGVFRRIDNGAVAFAPDGTPVELLWGPDRTVQGGGRPALLLRSAIEQSVRNEFVLPRPGEGRDYADPRVRRRFAISRDTGTVAASARFPDGSRLIAVWDAWRKSADPFRTWTLPSQGEPLDPDDDDSQLALSPDGTLLAFGGSQGEVIVWATRAVAAPPLHLPSNRIAVQSLLFHKRRVGEPYSGRRRDHAAAHLENWLLAAGDSGGAATIWSLSDRRILSICRGAYVAVYAMAFSPDGTLLATGGRSPVRLWDVNTGAQVLVVTGSSKVETLLDYVYSLDFSPDGRRLAIAATPVKGHERSFALLVWKLDEGAASKALRGLANHAAHTVFSRDGRRIAVFSQDWRVGIWDCRTGMLLGLFHVPEGYFPDNRGMTFDRTGRRFAFSAGTNAALWDIETGTLLDRWDLPAGMGDNLAFDEGGRLISVRFETRDGKVRPFLQTQAQRRKNPFVFRIRHLKSGKAALLAPPSEPFGDIRAVHISADAKWFAVVGTDLADFGKPDISRHQHSQVLRTMDAKVAWRHRTHHIRFTSDGRLIRLEDEGSTSIRRPSDGRILKSLVRKVSDSGPPGRFAIFAHDQRQEYLGLVSVFRDGNKRNLFTIGMASKPSMSFPHLSPDGATVAWSDGRAIVHLCDIEASLRLLRHHGLLDPPDADGR